MTRSTRPRDTEDANSRTTGTRCTGTRTTGTQAAGTGPLGQPPQPSRASQENAGWTILSYLVAGMVAYGLIGWLLATVTHTPVLLPLGAIVGLVVAIAGIAYKYGRS